MVQMQNNHAGLHNPDAIFKNFLLERQVAFRRSHLLECYSE